MTHNKYMLLKYGIFFPQKAQLGLFSSSPTPSKLSIIERVSKWQRIKVTFHHFFRQKWEDVHFKKIPTIY